MADEGDDLLNRIKKIGIYPPLGIARVGNSKLEGENEGWFIGPEVPTKVNTPLGGFKDKDGRVKRQGARFRVYAFDDRGQVIQELTTDGGFELKWKVHLANKKASWYGFQGKFDANPNGDFKTPAALRNPDVQSNVKHPDQRTRLIIDSGRQTVRSGNNQVVELSGKFQGSKEEGEAKKVELGTIRTDDKGRLIVLGGYGRSESIATPGEETPLLMTDFDNADWFDDTSDGSVDVTVTHGDHKWIPDYKAWVISTTPKFTTSIAAPTTLYDVIENVYRERARRNNANFDEDVEYHRHILPILERAVKLAWVNGQANSGHGPNGPGHFTGPQWDNLKDNSDKAKDQRNIILGRLRAPGSSNYDLQRKGQASPYFMPWLSGDGGRTTLGDPTTFTSLTELQYDRVKKWAEGKFRTDAYVPPPKASLDEYGIEEQPGVLTKGALEWTIGLPLYPGIEMSWNAEMEQTYNLDLTFEKFRIASHVKPGDLTKYLSLPWQSDFYMCRNYWWPSARPDAVIPETAFKELAFEIGREGLNKTQQRHFFNQLDKKRVPWERGLWLNHTDQYPSQPLFANTDMVRNWHQLGFIVEEPGLENEEIFVEKERGYIDHFTQRRKQALQQNTCAHQGCDKVSLKLNDLRRDNPLEDLQVHLQTAMQIELSTIPLYLFAMYSIKSSKADDPRYVDPVIATIRGIVSEEMLHLTLAGNVLKATGGSPKLYSEDVFPKYPLKMPGRKPSLIFHLREATKENMITFLEIEKPQKHPVILQALPNNEVEVEKYHTLGEFYGHIKQHIEDLGDDIFANPHTECQFAPGLGFNPRIPDAGGSVVVVNKATALKALDIIVEQGEGSKGKEWVDKGKGEKSHYERFKELRDRHHWETFPVKSNPRTNDYSDPRIRQLSRAFDAAYCYLLVLIEKLWTVGDETERRNLVLGNMYGIMIGVLPQLAKLLISLPLKNDPGRVAAPGFNYYKFHDRECALKDVIKEIEAALEVYVSETGETATQTTVKEYGAQIDSVWSILVAAKSILQGQQRPSAQANATPKSSK